MKKLLVILLVLAISITCFTSCDAAYGGDDTAADNYKIQSDFIKIQGYENLYYAKNTKIVYWIGGSYTINVIGDDYTTSYMTVWYAENGLPYRYNVTTRQLEMIEPN